ncbi:DUF2199 domain-containing protein [Lysobacter sp. CA199]|uniref:DUF2199 domain-containing protein n=1 Tax=Lysobacter sp. CA199 TaxID=3455608 RepID=UPI003F8D1C6B
MSGEPMRLCSCCGELVPLSELEYSFAYPDAYYALDEAARFAPGTRCNDNFCVIGERRWFVRGVIPLPMESGDMYRIGAWAELSADDWRTVWDSWDERGSDLLPPLVGTLANHIPSTYEASTLGLNLTLRLHDQTRPSFHFAGTGHPLEREQLQEITPHRARYFTGLGSGDKA